MFRYRIKDLMIVNAVMAITLGIAITLGKYLFQISLILGIILVAIVGPVVWVEIYLYRKKHGIWYRSKYPRKPRPQYQPMSDLQPYYPPVSIDDDSVSNQMHRTRLFETDTSGERVSRASLLYNVANGFETSGRIDAAIKVYRQILERFENTPEAFNASLRLYSLSSNHSAAELE